MDKSSEKNGGIDVVEEVAIFFSISGHEAKLRLLESWEHYKKDLQRCNPYDQSTEFDKWLEKTNGWYATSDAHIYEQTFFRYFLTPKAKIDTIVNLYRGRVLDFGCGIARMSLRALRKGKCDYVDLLDVNGLTSHFVRFLIQKRNLQDRCRVIHELDISQKYDVIILTDVLEHLVDPHKLLITLHQFLKENGVFVVHAPFSDLGSPTHLIRNKDLTVDGVMAVAGVRKERYLEVDMHGAGVCENGEYD